jgi:hypothetical protein
MADEQKDRKAERIIASWITALMLRKRLEYTRRKGNLRIEAILGNGIQKNRILLRKLRMKRGQGGKKMDG